MKLIISILFPNIIGFLGNLIGNPNNFDNIIKPNFTPNKIVFPIVWIVLYTLMGVSSYLVYKSNNINKKDALISYLISLIINSLWSFFFFNLKWYLFSFIWIILIIITVLIMIYKFYKVDKLSAYIQIPYLIWLIFAAILNFNIYLLN